MLGVVLDRSPAIIVKNTAFLNTNPSCVSFPMFRSLDPLHLAPSRRMIEESQSLRSDVFSDTTTLLDNYPRRYEPIRGTTDSDDVDLEHFTATGQPYGTHSVLE